MGKRLDGSPCSGECFWESGCANTGRCREAGTCLAAWQRSKILNSIRNNDHYSEPKQVENSADGPLKRTIEQIRRAHTSAKPKRSNPAWGNTHRDLGVVLDAYDLLLAENKRIPKDAARYRWLKKNHLQIGPDCWIRTGDDLDDAIDAEMAAASDGRQK